MDSMTNGYDPTLPIDFDGSMNPELLSEVTYGPHLEYPDGSVPMVTKANTGRMSPVRARTMKEYDSQIMELKKENFSLKLRIYFLEERMQQKFGDGEDVFKTNIELKVEVENLKRDLSEKQDLLVKASNAMENMSSNQQEELQQVKDQMEKEKCSIQNRFQEQVESAKREVESSQRSLQEATHQLTDFENEIERLKTEMRHMEQSKDIIMQALKEDLASKEKELEKALKDNKEGERKIGKLEEDKTCLQEQIERYSKELERRDCDIQQLCVVQDSSENRQSILMQSRLQYEVDDQREKVTELQTKVVEMQDTLKSKDKMIGNLEDILKRKESENKNLSRTMMEVKEQLLKQEDLATVRDSAIKGLHDEVQEKYKQINDLKDQLRKKDEEVKKGLEDLQDLSFKKNGEIVKQHEDLMYLEDQVSSMKVQQKQRDEEIEKLLKSQGKTEGELEGFKELLTKAENALQQSEDAVQDLQIQLQREKAKDTIDKNTEQLQFDLKEAQKQILHKDQVIKQLKESLKDKDRQIQQCMEIFKPTSSMELANQESIIKDLKSRLKEKETELKNLENEKFREIEDKNLKISHLQKKIDELQCDSEEKQLDWEKANHILLTAEKTIDRLENEVKEKDKDMKQILNKLKATQKLLEIAENQNADSKQRSADTLDKLYNTLKDKDKTIEALAESGQEKDQVITQMQRVGLDPCVELIKLKEQVMQLTSDIQDKNDLINMMKKSSEDGIPLDKRSDKQMEDLRIELAIKSEALKSSKETENDLRQLLLELKQKLDDLPLGQKEMYTLQKEVVNLKEKIERETTPPLEKKSSLEMQETLQAQLYELKRLSSALQKERQIVLNLTENRNISASDQYQTADQELSTIQALRKELEDGIQRNDVMRRTLNGLLREATSADMHGSDLVSKLTSNLDNLRKELTEKRKENSALWKRIHDLEQRCHIQTAQNSFSPLGKTCSSSVQSTNSPHKDLSPEKPWSPQRTLGQWSPSSGTLSPDFSIPLNRQSLSDMTAPMLRRFIRQLQQQLNDIEKENMALRSKLSVGGLGDGRKILGRNEDDANTIKQMRLEIDTVNNQLFARDREIQLLRVKLGVEAEGFVNYETLPSVKDVHNEVIRLKNQLKESEECCEYLKKQISETTSNGEFNPQLIIKMATEIQRLQSETENKGSRKLTCDSSSQTTKQMLPSQKVILNGLGQKKSSQIPRLQKASRVVVGDNTHLENAEILKQLLNEAKARIEQLENKLIATEGTVRLQTQKMKYYKSLLEDHGLKFKSPGISRSSSETNIASMAEIGIPVKKLFSSQNELTNLGQAGNGTLDKDSEKGLKCLHSETQTLHNLHDTFITRSSLHDLQKKVETLQQDFQEAENASSIWKQKLLEKEQAVSLLQKHLKDSSEYVYALESKLKNLQTSSLQQVLESQKEEIHKLQQKLSKTQNSCVQLESWLGEVRDFLDNIAFAGINGSKIRQRISESQAVVRSMSAEKDNDEDESQFIKQNKEKERSLELELKKKDAHIASLTESVRQKDLRLSQLHQDLTLTHCKLLSGEESGKDSSTSGVSAADGNVDDIQYRSHRDFPRDSQSPGSEGKDHQLNRTTESIERLRERNASVHTLEDNPVRDISCVRIEDDSIASTLTLQKHENYSQDPGRTLGSMGRDWSKHYMDEFDSEDRYYGQHRFADRDMFDHTMTPSLNGATEVSLLDGKQLFNSTQHDQSKHFTNVHGITSTRTSLMDISVQQVELDNLRSKCQKMEKLNKTLLDEVDMYENLCKSEGIQTSPSKPDSQKQNSDSYGIIRQNLSEFRALRKKLEKQLDYNEGLYQRLDRDSEANSVTNNVYVYSQHQSHVQDLQQRIDMLEELVREKESHITHKITIIKEKNIKISEFLSIIQEKEKKVKQCVQEKEEQEKKNSETAVLQRKQISQNNVTISKLQEKLEKQEQSIHMQEQKLKEQFEIIKQQDEQIESQSHSLEHKKSQLDKQNTLIQHQSQKLEKQRELLDQKEELITELTSSCDVQTKRISELEEKVQCWTLKAEAHMKQKDRQNVEANIKKLMKKVEEMEETIKYQEKKIKDQEDTIQIQEDKVREQEEWLTKKDETNYKLQKIREKLNQNLQKSSQECQGLKEELKVINEKFQMNKDLNKTLQLELSVYEKLEQQENLDTSLGGKDDLVRELLTELKHLRVALERCIDTNNGLREKLEMCIAQQTSTRPTTHTGITGVHNIKDSSPSRSAGTDVPDGHPSPDKPCTLHNSHLSVEQERRLDLDISHHQNLSQDSCLSDSISVTSSHTDHPLTKSGLSTWPLTSKPELPTFEYSMSTQAMTCHSEGELYTKMTQSDLNISYHVDDPPSLLADMTTQRIDSDVRSLFAIGKLDHYEKLRHECAECTVILKGMEARIQERLKFFKKMSPSEFIKSMEYSTLKELALSVENLRIYLHETNSLISCFWTSSLPNPETINSKLRAENESLLKELSALRMNHEILTEIMKDSKDRLHSNNQLKQQSGDYLYRKLKKTSKLFIKANSNFVEQARKAGVRTSEIKKPLQQIDLDNESENGS